VRRRVVASEGVLLPRPPPPEFRRRAVELARLRERPVAAIARGLAVSDSLVVTG
jgi:transposase-like protein